MSRSRKRQHNPKRRCERLARQLIIYGWRQERDEDLVGGVHRPLTMNQADCTNAYNWAINTPNRWWVRAIVICQADDGTEYRECVEVEMGQAVKINETSDYRLGLLREARDGTNPRHWVAEGFEMGIL